MKKLLISFMMCVSLTTMAGERKELFSLEKGEKHLLGKFIQFTSDRYNDNIVVADEDGNIHFYSIDRQFITEVKSNNYLHGVPKRGEEVYIYFSKDYDYNSWNGELTGSSIIYIGG